MVSLSKTFFTSLTGLAGLAGKTCLENPKDRHTLQSMDAPESQRLPDPWLFDSEALLRELDRCRELTLQIPTNGDCNATHFSIQIAVYAQWNLRENLRHLLHLHREQQRAIRREHEQSLSATLSQPASTTN